MTREVRFIFCKCCYKGFYLQTTLVSLSLRDQMSALAGGMLDSVNFGCLCRACMKASIVML